LDGGTSTPLGRPRGAAYERRGFLNTRIRYDGDAGRAERTPIWGPDPDPHPGPLPPSMRLLGSRAHRDPVQQPFLAGTAASVGLHTSRISWTGVETSMTVGGNRLGVDETRVRGA
jgi:hypothetical protein